MKAYLALEDGTVFFGKAIGASGEAIGELVFDTSITGYENVVTDPNYFSQIVVMTYPLIGNYGVNRDIISDKPHLKGLVAKEVCKTPSNWRSLETLGDYLKRNNTVGIEGVDTRLLTLILREKGTMNAIISTDENFDFNSVKEKILNYKINKPALNVSVKTKEHIEGKGIRIALVDFGVNKNIINSLVKRGCEICRFPAGTDPEEILDYEPHGIILSNGPGNPEEYDEQIRAVKYLLGEKPLLGIGLGHQLAALASGAEVIKLKSGHRGGNHPVKDLRKDRVYITSQNHGYAVSKESIEKTGAEITHVNINDGTVEGLKFKNIPAMTVQFRPDDVSCPSGTSYVYDEFFEMLKF